MKVAKKLLDSIILKVVTSVNNMHSSKLALAHELAWAQNVINWRYTDYNSWLKFCKAELPLGFSTVCMYISVSRLVNKFQYTEKECKQIMAAIGWSHFALGLIDSSRKLSALGFIRKYKNFSSTGSEANNPDGDRAYTFSLPKRQADIFDTVLTAYGMTTHKSGRRGVRDAMIKVVNRKLK